MSGVGKVKGQECHYTQFKTIVTEYQDWNLEGCDQIIKVKISCM